MTTPRVGFIGLGSQGGPIARRIGESGYPLTIWARRVEALEPFADTGASVAATPAELGAASDIVGVCVVADADVDDVLLRADGVFAGMERGGIVAIHSTVHPDTCRRLAEIAASRGITVVDAPVSGGGVAVEANGLVVMVGGPEDAVERCRPVFESYGNPVIHLGDVGSGQLAKLVNNLVFTAQLALNLDTFALADALGVDRGALADVLAHGSGGSEVAAIFRRSGFDVTGIAGAAALLRKDVDLALDVARARGATTDVLADLAETALDRLGRSLSR